MNSDADRIKPDSKSIISYLEDLQKDKYQIPTFQRDVVWDTENVKKLWDSIYRFYPLGSVLVWKTDDKLHNHREIGGNLIQSKQDRKSDFQYILDGQQRTTALFTSLYGGKIKGKDGFNPELYFNSTIPDEEDIDNPTYKSRFLFADELGSEEKQTLVKQGFILKLYDVHHDGDCDDRIKDSELRSDWDECRKRIRHMRNVLNNYRLSFIELRGIQVNEVCQIFERINQAGMPLDIFDIVVAKTYRVPEDGKPGFYLRELFDDYRKSLTTKKSHFDGIDNLTLLQILAVLVRWVDPKTPVKNITDRYLNDLKAEHIEAVWQEGIKAIDRTLEFFESILHLRSPRLIPYRYFYMTIAAYCYKNKNPDYQMLKQYFWYYAFHDFNYLQSTNYLWQHVEKMRSVLMPETPSFQFGDEFKMDKQLLRSASYSDRGARSRSIMALLASSEPRDWKEFDRNILSDVYYNTTAQPNLHHLFPVKYIEKHHGKNKVDVNSLMNIVYLTQLTNINISDGNPLEYLQEFDKKPGFDKVLEEHLISAELIGWVRAGKMPDDALDQLVELRTDRLLDKLRNLLAGISVPINIYDSAAPSPLAAASISTTP